MFKLLKSCLKMVYYEVISVLSFLLEKNLPTIAQEITVQRELAWQLFGRNYFYSNGQTNGPTVLK